MLRPSTENLRPLLLSQPPPSSPSIRLRLCPSQLATRACSCSLFSTIHPPGHHVDHDLPLPLTPATLVSSTVHRRHGAVNMHLQSSIVSHYYIHQVYPVIST
ncbi:hypothetical protein BDW22DRAFT_1363037 [Trametopsis cervina]|nr:hypothetical protein BDW22DRAFT_1363037 [Trametopsis cervina]